MLSATLGTTRSRSRAAWVPRTALPRLPGSSPSPAGHLLAVATGPYAGEGFDCPPLDTLFLATPVASKGRLLQYAGRILRPYDGKATAEVHDYQDELTGVLASSVLRLRTQPCPCLKPHPCSSCRMLVLMEHSTESVASSYIKAGDLTRAHERPGQWLERTGVGDALMRAVPVVELLELPGVNRTLSGLSCRCRIES